MKKIILVLGSALFVCDCVRHEKINKQENVQASAEIRETLNEYFKDVSKNGLSAEFKWFDSTADFFWVPPSFRSPLSYDSVRSILEQNAKATKSVNLEWESLKILPLDEDFANYTGTIRATVTDTSGHNNSIHLIETGTVVKRKNGWKLLCGQTAGIR